MASPFDAMAPGRAVHADEAGCGGRRRILLKVTAASVLFPWAALAQDDLLDPETLLQKRSSSPVAAPRASAPAAVKTASEARDTAAAVVGHIDSLTRALVLHRGEGERLDQQARDLVAEMERRRANTEGILSEYRRGLFCSGCGKTKSEILAVGQEFPHSGQRIVKASAAQITAKTRELQLPMERSSAELRANRLKKTNIAAELDELIVQLQAGVSFWRTCLSMEAALLAQADGHSEEQYRQKRSSLALALDRHRLAPASPGATHAVAQTQAELSRLNAARQDEKRQYNASLSRARLRSDNQKGLLESYFSRGDIARVLRMVVVASYNSPTAAFNHLGGMYRMGRYSKDGQGEIVPSVERFIAAFRHVGAVLPLAVSPAPQPRSLPAAPALDKTLRDLLQCGPEDGDTCDAPASGGINGRPG